MKFEATHRQSPGASAPLRHDARRTVLTDEPVSFRLTLEPLESQILTEVALQTLTSAGWSDKDIIWTRGFARTVASGSLRLAAGVLAIRCRFDSLRNIPSFTTPLFVDVRKAPPVLLLFSLGGFWTANPPTPPGPPDNQARLDEHGIWVKEDACRRREIDPSLIRELITNRNIQCNDLCRRSCVNFLEHLALRLMNEEGLADQLKSIDGTGYCHERTNQEGLDNRIILGTYQNSELEPMRPGGTRTWEQILDNYRSLDHRHVILLGQSHGGAKFAGMTRDHWRWEGDLTVDLFVSWDSADAFGGVSSVGPRPKKVLSFFQTGDQVWQKGASITEATVEHDLTGLFSHNAIARSKFVHDKTVTFIRNAIASVRSGSRGGHNSTFRIGVDGMVGECVERRRLPYASVAQAFQLTGTDFMCFAGGPERRLRIWRINEHGLLDAEVSDHPVAMPCESAAFYTSATAPCLLLVSRTEDPLIVRVNADGSVGSRVYPNTVTDRVAGALKGAWDHATAFRVAGNQFVGVGTSNGDIRIVRVNADGTPVSIVPNPIFGSSLSRLSSLVSFARGANTYLLALGDGMSVFRVNQDGSLGSPVWNEVRPLGALYFSRAARLRVGNEHFLVLHDTVGHMQIRRINTDGSVGPPVGARNTDQTGQIALTTFESAGLGYAFLLDRTS